MLSYFCSFILRLFLIPYVSRPDKCPAENVFNNKCIQYGGDGPYSGGTWHYCEEFCNSVGRNGHLVSIGSVLENNFVSGKSLTLVFTKIYTLCKRDESYFVFSELIKLHEDWKKRLFSGLLSGHRTSIVGSVPLGLMVYGRGLTVHRWHIPIGIRIRIRFTLCNNSKDAPYYLLS